MDPVTSRAKPGVMTTVIGVWETPMVNAQGGDETPENRKSLFKVLAGPIQGATEKDIKAELSKLGEGAFVALTYRERSLKVAKREVTTFEM